jgi:large subunit ribosomal protein L37Ae
MAAKKKKIGASGRFGAGYGRPKERLNAVEQKQRVKQPCPFCDGRAKRTSKGVWKCVKCSKIFTGGTFYLS